MKGSPFIRGTIFLTMATMISKMLGFIYVIPFTAMVGTSGYVYTRMLIVHIQLCSALRRWDYHLQFQRWYQNMID